VYYHFYRTGDVVHYFQDARKLWTLLPERPDDYLHLVFGYARDGVAPEHLHDVYEHLRGSWRTPEFLSVRVHGVLGLVTGMHFYANVVLLNGASLAGLVLLHAAFARTWPRAAGWLAVPVFFLPSALFWCSGIHKDAFALLAIGLAVYALTMPRAGLRARHGLLLAGAAFLLLNSRPYLLLLLLPTAAVLAWGLRPKAMDPRGGPRAEVTGCRRSATAAPGYLRPSWTSPPLPCPRPRPAKSPGRPPGSRCWRGGSCAGASSDAARCAAGCCWPPSPPRWPAGRPTG
jgi:hypothetical protein